MLLRLFSFLAFKLFYFIFSQICSRLLGLRLNELFVLDEGAGGSLSQSGSLSGVNCLCKELKIVHEGWNKLLRDSNIPLRVVSGGIGHIEFEFGWSILFGRLSLKAHRLYLLAQTTSERYYNHEWHLEKKLQLKRQLVRKFEQLEGKSSSPEAQNIGIISRCVVRLLIKLIRNIEISLQDIHIRFEDELSLINEACSAGFALKYINMKEDKQKVGSRKAVEVDSVCAYWNHSEETESLLSHLPQEHAMEKMRSINPATTQILGCCYVLKPSCVSGTVTISNGKLTLIQCVLHVNLKGVNIELSKEQMRVSGQCLGYFKHQQNTAIFLEHRPALPVKENPKQWWFYAVKCISLYFNRSKWDWLDLKGKREHRTNYSLRYEEFLKNGMTRKLKEKLQSLEDEMSLLNILLVRKRVEAQVETETLKGTQRRRRFSWLRSPTKWRIKHGSRDNTTEGQLVMYSISAQCSVADVNFTLTDEGTLAKHIMELFTLHLINIQLSLMKEETALNFEVSLGYVNCIGAAPHAEANHQEEPARPDLLMWNNNTDKGLPVLSVKLESKAVDHSPNQPVEGGGGGGGGGIVMGGWFDHEVTATLKPSVIILDWYTVQYLSQFVALLTSTHKDLKDAVKERVKEVGREGQIKLRHFIANKELASVTADLHLPLIVLRDTLIGKQQHVALHCGHLSLTTTKDKEDITSKGVTLIFNGNIRGIKLILQQQEITSSHWLHLLTQLNDPNNQLVSLEDDNLLICKLDNLNTVASYTTFYSVPIPSKLTVSTNSSELRVGLSNQQLEDILEFFYGQLSSLWTAISIATNTLQLPVDNIDEGEEVDAPLFTLDDTDISDMSSLEPLVSTVYHDLKRFSVSTHSPLLARSLTQLEMEGADKGTEDDDYAVLVYDASIDKIEFQLKHEESNGWMRDFVVLQVSGVGVVCEMREQASQLVVRVDRVLLKNVSRSDANGCPVKLLEASKEFLHIKYTQANPKTPLFGSAYNSTEDESIMNINHFTLCLHRDGLIDILSLVTNLSLPPFKSLMSSNYSKDINNVATTGGGLSRLISGVSPPPLYGHDSTRLSYAFTIKGFVVTMATEKAGTVVEAIVNECRVSYIDKYNSGELTGSCQKVSILDKLLYYSPNYEILSSQSGQQLLNGKVFWRTENKESILTGHVSVGSVQLIYLNKFRTTIHAFLSELLQYWFDLVEGITMKLAAAVVTVKKSKTFPRQPQRQKLGVLLWSYKIMIHMENSSLMLPKDSNDLDNTLKLYTIDTTNISYTNRSRTQHSLSIIREEEVEEEEIETEEPDTGPVNGSAITGPVIETTVSITTDTVMAEWIFVDEKTTIATAHNLSLSYSHSHSPYYNGQGKQLPWELTLPNIEMSVTPEGLATVPALFSSNFTESEPLGLPWLPEKGSKSQKGAVWDLSSSSSSSCSSSSSTSLEDNTNLTSTSTSSFTSTSPPLIKLIISEWLLKLLYKEEQQDVTMATVKFEKANCSFGYKTKGRSRRAWLKGFIDEIAGVEGAINDSYHGNLKILGRGKGTSVIRSTSPLIKWKLIREQDGEMKISGGVCNVCLCLWPNFINTSLSFMRQCKVREGVTRRGWRRRGMHMRSRSTVVRAVATPIRRIIRRSSSIKGVPPQRYLDTPIATPIITPTSSESHNSTLSLKPADYDNVSSPPPISPPPLHPLSNHHPLSPPPPPLSPPPPPPPPPPPTNTTTNTTTGFNLRVTMDECMFALLEDPEPQEILTPGVCVEFHSLKANTSTAAVLDYTSKTNHIGLTLSPCTLRAHLCLYGESVIPLNQVVPPTSLEFHYILSQSLEKVTLRVPRLELNLSDELRQIFEQFHLAIFKPVIVKRRSTTAVSDTEIWVVKTINRAAILPELPFDEGTDSDGVEDDDDVFTDSSQAIKNKQEATVEFNDFLINFDVICAGDSSTVMCLHSSAYADIQQWSHDVSIDVQLTLEGFVYNENVASWEPFIEPLEDAEIGDYRPYKLQAKVYHMNDWQARSLESPPGDHHVSSASVIHSLSSDTRVKSASTHHLSPADASNTPTINNKSAKERGGGAVGGASYIIICTSDDHLELTLTPSTITTIRTFLEAQTKEHYIAMGNIRSAIQDSRPPLRVENQTGMEIFIFPGPTFQDGNCQKKYTSHVLLPRRSMRRLKSITESNDETDFFKQTTNKLSNIKLPTVVEEEEEEYGGEGGGEDTDGVGLYLNKHRSSPLGTIEEEEGEEEEDDKTSDIDIDSSMTSGISLSDSIASNELPFVIEGAIGGEGGGGGGEKRNKHDYEETDGAGYSGKRRASSMKFIKSRMTRQTSTSSSTSTAGPDSYWRPKALFKAHKMKLQLQDSSKSGSIKISHPGVNVVSVKHTQFGWISVMCDVSIRNNIRKVVIHSGLQVKNTLPFNVAVFSRNVTDSPAPPPVLLGDIEREKTFCVPLEVLAKQQHLSFAVGSDGIPCTESLYWKKMDKNRPVILTCPESTEDGNKFYIQASLHVLPALNITRNSASHMIHLEPPLILCNHLPLPLTVTLQATPLRSTHSTESIVIESNDEEQIVQFHWKEVVIKIKFDYKGLLWQGHSVIKLNTSLATSVPLEGFDKTGKSISKIWVCLQTSNDQVSRLNLFVPFWIVNKTGLGIEYEHQSGKGKSVRHCSPAAVGSLPVLITYNKTSKSDHEHQKVKLRVTGGGEWSKPFVIGIIGKSYSISSKLRNGFIYEFSVDTHLLKKNALTEVVHIIPKYSLLNETDVPLVCLPLASDGDRKVKYAVELSPKELVPFWPGSWNRVSVSINDHEISSIVNTHQFSLNVASPMVLPMNNKSLPVLTVKIQHDPVKSTAVVSLQSYADTGALLEVVNLSHELSIKFMQGMSSGSGQLYTLSPDQSILYTWDSPAGERQLKWQVIGAVEKDWHTLLFEQVKQAGSVTVNVARDDIQVGGGTGGVRENWERDRGGSVLLVTCYWVTMFEGSQLTLTFFDNKHDLDRLLKLRRNKDSPDTQVFCSLEGIGLSLVNDIKEVMYCTISSSSTVWMRKAETNSRSRSESPSHGIARSPNHKGAGSPFNEEVWSPISREHCALLETAWRTREKSVKIAEEEYDLENMKVSIERGGNGFTLGSISRSFNPGIWVHYLHSAKSSSTNIKLGRVQIDNQLDDVELPTRVVFSSKEMQHLSTEITDPFLDFILTLSTQDAYSIRQIEKCFLKIKPLRANIELGLVAALLPFTDVIMASNDTELDELGKEEMTLINKPLKDILKTDSLVKVRTVNHIDVLQITQASLSVTYTTAGEYDLSSQWGRVVNALIHFALITKGSFDINLKSVTITNEVLDAEQMKRLVWGHYKNEMLLQFQKLALGLDVIGNPVKLLNSFQVGAKDLVSFSRQGLTEGDAGTHIATGVKSFLGHFIEGSAGSGVRSTSVISSILLAATDIEYQRKHRYMRQARNERDLTSNLKLGSSFFIKGVLGAADIVVKPITGASTEGFEGFMKGIGRGAISVLVKPTLGAVDLAKYTMEAIRSSVDDELAVETSRLPRLVHCDKVVTPYNSHESEGLYIIRHLSEPLLNEHYIFHEWLPPSKTPADPLLLLVTSKQLMQLRKSQRHYRCEWSTGLESIIQTKATTYSMEDEEQSEDYSDTGILLEYKDDNIFRKKQNKFLLKLEDTVGAQVIEEKINNARKTFKKHNGFPAGGGR